MISRKIFFGVGAIVLLSQSVVCFCVDAKSQDIFNDAIAGGIATYKANGRKVGYKGDHATNMQNYKSVIDFMVSKAGIALGQKKTTYDKMFEGVTSITGDGEKYSEALKKTLEAIEKLNLTPVDKFAIIMSDDMVGGKALTAVEGDKVGKKVQLEAVQSRINAFMKK